MLMSAFEAAEWDLQARYLVLVGSWEERADVLARLEEDAALLPNADAEIISRARPPRLSHRTKRALSVALICCGLSILAWQLRGLSRGEIDRRLGRG
jgi:ferric-dicitrate binding protein FerR (iron transport regulator)